MPPKRRATKKKAGDEELIEPIVNGEAINASSDPIPAAGSFKTEPVILQLPIAPCRLQSIMDNTSIHGILEYSPNIVDPQPYIPDDAFHSNHDTLDGCNRESNTEPLDVVAQNAPDDSTEAHTTSIISHGNVCYWCCHHIPHIEYGMPIRYDVFHKSFTLFGSFCSLECAAAYNFTTHMGSDRVWEIHSWIQMLAHRYGYQEHVRPAPSRYLLKMFNGPLGIKEFREAHKGLARTFMMNIPPFIHVVSQMEVLNTSFLDKKGGSNVTVELKKSKKRT